MEDTIKHSNTSAITERAPSNRCVKNMGENSERQVKAAVEIQVQRVPVLILTVVKLNHCVEQRLYRGYRERRQLNGISLSPEQRWSQVCIVIGLLPAV
jgi:hypothetical protein